MRLFDVCATILTLAVAVSALATHPPLKVVERSHGEVSGKHIIRFKKGVTMKGWMGRLRKSSNAVKFDIINGVARKCSLVQCTLPSPANIYLFIPSLVELDDDELEVLRGSDDVDSIADDPIMYAFATQYAQSPIP